MSSLPRMILILLWWTTIGGFLANNWSQVFTAVVTRPTQDAAGPPPSSGAARWWGFLTLAPLMVNHNARSFNWEESFYKYGVRDPGPHRAQCPSSQLLPSRTLLLLAGSRAQCPSSPLLPPCTLSTVQRDGLQHNQGPENPHSALPPDPGGATDEYNVH